MMAMFEEVVKKIQIKFKRALAVKENKRIILRIK